MTSHFRQTEIDAIEQMARSLNDDWAAGSQGARWHNLEESEREHWRTVARVVRGETPSRQK